MTFSGAPFRDTLPNARSRGRELVLKIGRNGESVESLEPSGSLNTEFALRRRVSADLRV
jgi:hypothetical protein